MAIHSGAHTSWQRQWLPLAASIMIGVAIGYLIHPGGGTAVDSSGAAGSMVPAIITAETPSFEIDLGDGVGTFTASGTGSTLVIDAILTGTHEIQVGVEAADGSLEILETEQIHSQPSTVRAADRVFAFSANGPGTHHFAVEASEKTAVSISVWAVGIVIAYRLVHLDVASE